MKAIAISAPGGPDVLRVVDLPPPVPGEGELLVRVHASGVNRADVLQRQGRYPAPPDVPAEIPGLEFAGVVEHVAGGCGPWKPGDRVMGIVGGGSYAEYLRVPQGQAMPIPPNWSFAEAAAVPEAFITAYDALVLQASLERGERVLIHAVGSSVGLAALRISKLLGAHVAGSSRTPAKLDGALAQGLDRAILVRETFDPDDLQDWADVVANLVGGAYLAGDLRAAAVRARIILIGLVAGSRSNLDLRLLLSKRITIRGTVLRSRTVAEKASVSSSFADRMLPKLLSSGERPFVDSVYDAEQAAEAHRRVEANQNFGAVVLTWT